MKLSFVGEFRKEKTKEKKIYSVWNIAPRHINHKDLKEFPVTNNTYLLTPWCKVLLENLTDFQPVKKFPAFYGTRRFITAFTSSRHLSLS